MFIAALFTNAKMWKQPIHPSTDIWVKKTHIERQTEIYVAIYVWNITQP